MTTEAMDRNERLLRQWRIAMFGEEGARRIEESEGQDDDDGQEADRGQ